MSKQKKRIYESEALGLPPLQMVLVHHDRKRAAQVQPTAPMQTPPKEEPAPTEAMVQKLIQHLEKKQ
jgi:hypothetical protein